MALLRNLRASFGIGLNMIERNSLVASSTQNYLIQKVNIFVFYKYLGSVFYFKKKNIVVY